MTPPSAMTLLSLGICNPFEARPKLGDISAHDSISRHDRELRAVQWQFTGGKMLEERHSFSPIGFPRPT